MGTVPWVSPSLRSLQREHLKSVEPVADLKDATTVTGGGDSVNAVKRPDLQTR